MTRFRRRGAESLSALEPPTVSAAAMGRRRPRAALPTLRLPALSQRRSCGAGRARALNCRSRGDLLRRARGNRSARPRQRRPLDRAKTPRFRQQRRRGLKSSRARGLLDRRRARAVCPPRPRALHRRRLARLRKTRACPASRRQNRTALDLDRVRLYRPSTFSTSAWPLLAWALRRHSNCLEVRRSRRPELLSYRSASQSVLRESRPHADARCPPPSARARGRFARDARASRRLRRSPCAAQARLSRNRLRVRSSSARAVVKQARRPHRRRSLHALAGPPCRLGLAESSARGTGRRCSRQQRSHIVKPRSASASSRHDDEDRPPPAARAPRW